MKITNFIAYIALMTFTVPAAANLAAPHKRGGEAPYESAFLHFINADLYEALGPSVNGKQLNAVKKGEIGQYTPVPKGHINIKFGRSEGSADVSTGVHYLVALHGRQIITLPEADYPELRKAHITLVNLSNAKSASLRTPSGAPVIDNVTSDALGDRAINSAKVGLSVFADGGKVIDMPAYPFAIGDDYLVILFNDAQGKLVSVYGLTSMYQKQ